MIAKNNKFYSGPRGKSAYEVAVKNGFEGTEQEWLDSLRLAPKGDDGFSPTIVENANNTEDNYKLDITTESSSYTTPNLKGRQGVQGLQGVKGEKGEKGDVGQTGATGADGVSPTVTENAANSDTTYKLDIVDITGTHTTPNLIGRQGAQGLKGDKGETGEKGEQGIQGNPGADGVSPLVTTNTANTEDIYKLDITDANGTYTTPNLIGRQGPQGIQGEKGEQGIQGPQGIQGIQGERGADGYPFLIYRDYQSLDEFDPDHFPEIGLMFMVKPEEGLDNYPVYRYTGMADTPYSFVTDLATSEGLKGDKGEKGDQGEQGIQGEKGADGITYTPVIGTVTTVGSTSDAAADIVIDSEAKTATFNFSLPKGAAGAIGGKGDKGEKGETGEKGDKGIDGITYTPAIGTVNTVDSASDASASVDIDTDNSRATFNFSIPRGQDGAQGIQGIPGEKGEQGEPGIDGEDGTTYIPSVGTVTTVSSAEEATANVSLDDENKQAIFNFAIPKGVSIEKVEFTSSTLGEEAGIPGATDTYTITFTNATTTTYEVYNGKDCDVQIDDENDPSENAVYSSAKVEERFVANEDLKTTATLSPNQHLKVTLATNKLSTVLLSMKTTLGTGYTTFLISNYGGGTDARCRVQQLQGERKFAKYIDGCDLYITPSVSDQTWYATAMSVQGEVPILSASDTYSGTEITTNSVPKEIVDGLISDTTSSTTSTYSSAKIDELNANRQVKTFDNSGSSTEKWYKLCSAITGGIGCNIKLTASRADSTATVQYFSALFRDSRYRYTSSYIAREKTVYESGLVAEYSAYIVADANNNIWVHVPSYGKAIVEIDTRAITIDGTAGTPVKDYVYNSFRLQTIDESFERINIKQFNQPGSNTSFKHVTITSSGNGLGGLELNVPYAGKYMFSAPKSEPVYFGSSTHKGYTLNGWAWSDDGKTLHLRVAGFAPFSISVLGSVPNDINANNVVTISDMTSTAPQGVAFVSSPVYSNATTNDIGIKSVFYATSTSYPAIFTIHSKSTTGVFWFKHTRIDAYGLKSVEGYYDIKNSNIIILNQVGADLEIPLSCSVYADENAKEYGVKITALWQYKEGHVAITEARPVTAIPYKITY